ncbi:hypothetical protein EON73_03090, partial [bacterium]
MSNNKIILNGCIDAFKAENELETNTSDTFELFSLAQITKTYDLAFEDIENSIVDGGNDGGIDSIIAIVDDFVPLTVDDISDINFTRKTNVILIITQCKKENSFKEIVLDKIITTLPELFNLEKSEAALLIRFNNDLVDRALMAREIWRKCTIAGGKLKVIFNYCAFAETIEVNNVFEAKVEQLKNLAKANFIGAEVNYVNYSSDELLKLYQAHKTQRFSIKYKENPLSTSYLNYGIGYVGTVKLADYKAFLMDEDDQTIREDLFESNIRHFQGLVDVNKKIKESIENPNKEDFWWLNNGITIIASNPSLVGTILSVDNVQIVNGLQTSYSIFINHNGDLSDTRSVLVKVLINEDKPTIDHIIASTNSQNPVSPALLRATDDVQRDIEILFFNSGYFYDRRKNFYKNQGKPVSRIFSIQTAAQAIESIIFSNPYSARSKPTSLIKEDVTYNRIFNANNNYEAYLNSCLLLKKTIEFWSSLEDKNLKTHLSNFKLHLARISTSFVLNKASINLEQLSKVNIELFDETIFQQSINLMLVCITTYQTANTNANLINMAKTKGVTDVM